MYQPRYYPDWRYDPYRLAMSEKEPVQAIAYSQKSQAYDNAGYYSTSSLRKAGGYNLGEYNSLTEWGNIMLVGV